MNNPTQRMLQELLRLRRLLASAGRKGVTRTEIAKITGWPKERVRYRMTALAELGETRFIASPGAKASERRWIRVYVKQVPLMFAAPVDKYEGPYEDDPMLPFKRRVVAATEAQPMGKPGPASVFEWGRW